MASLGSAGCRQAEAEKKDAKPPEVDIESPYQDEVREYQEFTGQTVAVETIEIRARVSGYLEKNFFKDGALVEEGALLFQIDDRPYRFCPPSLFRYRLHLSTHPANARQCRL